jgi:RNA recognition motif-containing protein
MFSPNVDCFGRDKHADYRDDMGGVGSFMRQNLTLYIGRIHVTDDIEEVVARHFSEWGDIERIRILNSRGVAFVTYMNEVNAQFAKEAMAHQSLDHNEILNIRWATQDPNPLAMAREKRRLEEQAAEAIRRALPPEFLDELEEGIDREAKRQRLGGETFGLPGYDAPDKIWYNRDKLLEAPQADETVEEEKTDGNGIFGDDTLERLKALKEKSAKKAIVPVPVPASANANLLGFGDYGSDDDEE